MNTAGNRNGGIVARTLCVALCTALYATAAPIAHAQSTAAAESVRQYDIPAGSLSAALSAWGAQSDRQLVFAPDLISGKQSKGLSGRYGAEQALTQLLAGTELTWERVNGQTIAIKRASAPAEKPQARSRSAPARGQSAESETKDLDTIIVTGTRIRGGTSSSPVITIDSRQIEEEGFHDLGDVIRSIPQNFSGGQNPGVATGASLGDIANQNVTGGSAINLRGLGGDATLTLLNGRRLAYNGYVQAVDISTIPVEAVERIEIVPDGASAIYGSDAVAGVANVVIKRDFDGVTLGTRYGRATEDGLDTREYTATAGATWSSGGLIATWKKSSSDPLFSDQRDYTEEMYDPTTLYPGLDTSSVLLSAHQSLGDVAELRLDALKTSREQTVYYGYGAFSYDYLTDASVSLVSPSIQFFLPNDWSVTLGGTFGKDNTIYKMLYATSTTSTLTSYGCYCNKSHSYEAGAEGPLFAMGGGDARLAVGIGTRTDDYENKSYLSSTTLYGGDGSSRYGYAEFNLPFVSPDSNIAGIHRLEISAAVRSEDYDSYGRVTTPKLGVIYDPSADFTLKASWGRSFKVPTLLQRYLLRTSYLMGANTLGGSGYASDATVLVSNGGSDNLDPERARTWTTSVAFHPEALPALEAELTWFNIDYTDRVVLPVSNIYQALSNPIYADFVDYTPTDEEQAALLAEYSDRFIDYTGAGYDADKVVAIISAQYTNTARQRINGLDLSGSYRFDLGDGLLTFRGSATRLNSSQQNSAGQSYHDLAGNIFYPAKYRGRFGAVWAQGGFSASSFVNYTSGVTSKLTTSTEEIASFTTADVAFRYDTGERGNALSDLVFELSVQNMFNREPPLFTSTSIYYPGYDSTNYSAVGRFLSLSVSKHW